MVVSSLVKMVFRSLWFIDMDEVRHASNTCLNEIKGLAVFLYMIRVYG